MRVPLLAALIVAADQLTKFLAVTRLKPLGTYIVLPGFFNLSYVENKGAAWGMLAGQHLFLILFSLITLGFLLWKRKALFANLWGGTVTLALIMGGVLGNLIDRTRLTYVIDFLDFHWHAAHFPAFNIADASICCGVFLFIATQWQHDKKTQTS
ncbi:MAG: signal peptidase II [bacterium]